MNNAEEEKEFEKDANNLMVLMDSFPTPEPPLTQSEIDTILDTPNLARSRAARALVGSNPTLLERDFIMAMDNPRSLYDAFKHAGADHIWAFVRLGGLGSGLAGGTGLKPNAFTWHR